MKIFCFLFVSAIFLKGSMAASLGQELVFSWKNQYSENTTSILVLIFVGLLSGQSPKVNHHSMV